MSFGQQNRVHCRAIRSNPYQTLGIMTPEAIEQQKQQLRALPAGELPAVWGIHRVTALA